MSSDQLAVASSRDEARIETWRYEQLYSAGYPAETAMLLAPRRDVDLHAAVALVSAGCPMRTALSILL